MDIPKILKALTPEDKAALVQGTDFMYTNSIPKLNVPSLCLCDGPHGLRKQLGEKDNGVSLSEPATAFPTAATVANSWNKNNLYIMGEAIGEECRFYNVHILLGPAINIKRNPLCGRNFEYYSEDQLLTGELASSFVDGLQSQNVGACLKHFAVNSQENYRFNGNCVMDERTAREIYLKAFEMIVKKSQPASIMCAYNKINEEYCSENKWLLDDVLRNEWGFKGFTMTDWGAANNRIKGIQNGLDLEMPGSVSFLRKQVFDAIKNGTLEDKYIDLTCSRILEAINKYGFNEKTNSFNIEKHSIIAENIATDSAVLLKNNENTLPLNKDEEIYIVGDLFEKMRFQGSGSSMINPTSTITPKDAFDKRNIKYVYNKGYKSSITKTNKKLFKKAIIESKKYEKIVIFAGLTDLTESEGGDRENMNIAQNQLDLINALIKEKKKIILVLFGGSPIDLPFENNIDSILHMYLPGQYGGEACAKLLFGEACPSGKLAETWPMKYEDVLYANNYSKSIQELYKESVYIGYRKFDKSNIKPRYPFGFGLSYTKFDYSDLKVIKTKNKINVSCKIKNIGDCDGAEIVQLYVKNNKNSSVFKAEKELKAFSKVYLKKLEQKEVNMTFEINDLCYYNIDEKRWILESGTYEILVAASSIDIKLKEPIEIEGEIVKSPYSKEVLEEYEIPKEVSNEVFEGLIKRKIPEIPKIIPFTTDTRFGDFRKTLSGKLLFKMVTMVSKIQLIKAKMMKDGIKKENSIKGAHFLYKIFETNCIRSLSFSAGDSMPYNLGEFFVNFGNGHYIKAFKKLSKPYIAPKLPKDENKEN